MSMSDTADSDVTGSDLTDNDVTGNDELLSRLRLIEDQPLAERAASFTRIHDELQSNLERGDTPRRNS